MDDITDEQPNLRPNINAALELDDAPLTDTQKSDAAIQEKYGFGSAYK